MAVNINKIYQRNKTYIHVHDNYLVFFQTKTIYAAMQMCECSQINVVSLQPSAQLMTKINKHKLALERKNNIP